MRVWDLQERDQGRRRHTLWPHEVGILCLAGAWDEAEADGSFRLATAGRDQRALLWRVDEASLPDALAVGGLPAVAWARDYEAMVHRASLAPGDGLDACTAARAGFEARCWRCPSRQVRPSPRAPPRWAPRGPRP